MTRLAMGLLFSMLLATACDKKDESAAPAGKTSIAATSASGGAFVAPSAAPAAATPGTGTPASASAKAYEVGGDGKVSIDMPAPNEHIKASAKKTGGEISIDPTNLAATRGSVKVDLTTLKTFTFNDSGKDTKQTEHALNWLEVGTLVTPEEKEKNRFIVFTIKSVEGLNATDLTKVTAGADGARVVTATAKGEVLLHGKTSQREAQLSVTFKGPADKPTSVDIKTTKPLKVVLADHDVKPRDNLGKLAQASFNLLGTKVANEADISLELSAKPK